MKINKGAYSEYAIAAFVRAAEWGYPSTDAARKRQGATEAMLADNEAVYQSIADLRREGRDETVRAVMAVYRPCGKDSTHIPRSIRHERVVIYSLGCSYSEESVYRMLAEARRIFARHRGLTVD